MGRIAAPRGVAVLVAAALAVSCGHSAAANAALPDGRAYELVSAGDKLGNQVDVGGALKLHFAADGENAVIASFGGFEGSSSTPTYSEYRAARGPSGWSLTPLIPLLPDGAGFTALDYSTDYRKTLSLSAQDILGDGGAGGLYVSDGRQTTRVAPPGTAQVNYAGASAALDHVVFNSAELLDPREQDPDTGRVAGVGLYETVGGTRRLVAVDDDGRLLNQCGALIAGGNPGLSQQLNPVSDDGSKIFFSTNSDLTTGGCPSSPADDDAGQLFVRIDGRRTVEMSSSQRSTPDPAGRQLPIFLGATPTGSRAFFSSTELLTDDEPAAASGAVQLRLYAYDVADGTLTDLTPHTVDADGAPTTSAPGVGQVPAFPAVIASPSGRRVYFGATGRLTRDAPADSPAAGQTHVYLWDDGTLRYVTTAAVNARASSSDVVTSEDGSKLAFATRTRITSYDNEGVKEIYVYDVTTGGPPVCVSCNPSGQRPVGDASSPDGEAGRLLTLSGRLSARYVTDDGRVFFQSPDPLVATDTNGKVDVYEYVPGAGPQLITSGIDSSDSQLIGASADGASVAFSTLASLVPADVDNGDRDVYVARVGGGFASAAQGESCLEDSCQGVPSALPAFASPGTGAFGAAGHLIAGPGTGTPPAFRVDSAGGPELRRWATAGTLRIAVRVSDPGTVTATARARVGRRDRQISSARRRASKSGRLVLTLKLSAAARAELRRRGRLRVAVAVGYSEAKGSRRVSFTLRRPTKSAKARGER